MNLMDTLNSCIVNGQVVNSEKMLEMLGQLTNQLKDDSHRSALISNYPELFSRLEWLLDETTDDPRIKLECYRILRNAMVFHENQNHLREMTRIIQKSLEFLQDTDACSKLTDTLLHRICLQFLINCIIGNETNAALVGDTAKNFICWYLDNNFKEAAYLVNTLLNIRPEFALNFVDAERFQLFLSDLDSEPNLLCLETLASNTQYLRITYHNLSMDQRISFLHLVTTSPCKKSVEFFLEVFQVKADSILKSDLNRIETDFEEILELTCLVSGFNQVEEINLMQEQGGFIMTVIQLLKMTKAHETFAPIEKLTKFTKEEQDHPTFMFKAHLVRLVGNLAYRHLGNQMLIGQHCLSIILDYTKIDTLNPFISQWSILAIRNLLEGCTENQNIVKDLKLHGPAYSSVLQEFGIQVAMNEENKPCLENNPS